MIRVLTGGTSSCLLCLIVRLTFRSISQLAFKKKVFNDENTRYHSAIIAGTALNVVS